MIIINRQRDEKEDPKKDGDKFWKRFRRLFLIEVFILLIIFFSLGMSVEFALSMISFETEAKFFRDLKVPAVEATYKPTIKLLQKAEIVIAGFKRNEKVPPLNYRFVLIDHEKPNAFAFPGGTIGLTRGLLDSLEDEIELAFVLGRELGHFHHRDHLYGMGHIVGFKVIMGSIFESESGVDSFQNMIEYVFKRDYSREREKKADLFSLELINATYGKNKGLDRLSLFLFDKRKIPFWAYMFKEDPHPIKRINGLKMYAATLKTSS